MSEAHTQRDTRSKDGAIAALGLHPRVGWRVATAMFFVAGAVVIALAAIGELPASAPSVLIGAGATGLTLAPVWFACERLGLDERWLHVPASLGMIIIVVGATAVSREAIGAFLLLLLFPIIGTAYLMSTWQALPHIVMGLAAMAVFTLTGDQPATATATVVLAFVVIVSAAVLMVAQQRLRTVVAVNRALAEVDPLTGVANLRRLRARLRDELAQLERGGAGFALFTIDLDNFKLVNDTAGHTAGDRMLRAAAAAIERSAAPGDLVARRGGDEFLLLKLSPPDLDPAATERALATAIATARRSILPGLDPAVSVAHVPARRGESASQLLRRADAALHDAKLLAHPERAAVAGRIGADAVVTHDDGSRWADSPGSEAGHDDDIAREDAARLTVRHQRATDQKVAWRIAALLFAALPLCTLTIGFTGVNPEFRSPAFIATTIIAAAFAPVCARFSRTGAPEPVVHLSIVLTLAVTTALIASTQTSRLAMSDLYILVFLFTFYYMEARHAVLYLIAALAPLSWFVLKSDYDYAATKLGVTVAVIVVISGLLGLTRRRVQAYAAHNVNLSGIDPLTGAANLRRLRTYLADRGADRHRLGLDLAVVMVDLDNFKQVNDRYSHSTGDATLRAVASALRSAVRETDLVARRGGDEFAVVLNLNAPLDDRIAVVVRMMQDRIATARRAICPELNPGASFGVVTRRPGESVDDLLRRADLELHAAKLGTHAAEAVAIV